MIVKVRIPETSYPVERVFVVADNSFSYRGEILEVTPELTLKERLLSKAFSLAIEQVHKEVLAEIINKIFEDKPNDGK